jgi:hypothetical protein
MFGFQTYDTVHLYIHWGKTCFAGIGHAELDWLQFRLSWQWLDLVSAIFQRPWVARFDGNRMDGY